MEIDRERSIFSQIAAFGCGSEGRSYAFAGSSAGTANAMDKVFSYLRNVVVNDMRNMLHIDAARSYVGSNEDAMTAFGEALQGLIALRLRAVAVNLRGRVTGANQAAGDAICTMLGANKDQEAAFAGFE
jgi:hypothetical protein